MKTLLNCNGNNTWKRKVNVGSIGKGMLSYQSSVKSINTIVNQQEDDRKKQGAILYDFSANKNIDEISIREGESVQIEHLGMF